VRTARVTADEREPNEVTAPTTLTYRNTQHMKSSHKYIVMGMYLCTISNNP